MMMRIVATSMILLSAALLTGCGKDDKQRKDAKEGPTTSKLAVAKPGEPCVPAGATLPREIADNSQLKQCPGGASVPGNVGQPPPAALGSTSAMQSKVRSCLEKKGLGALAPGGDPASKPSVPVDESGKPIDPRDPKVAAAMKECHTVAFPPPPSKGAAQPAPAG